jgi:hypothetical protein
MADFYISQGTRAKYRPSPDAMNISMDFNASPSGGARGTEVIIPDNASPSVRAAAERYNQLVAGFAEKYGISNYPVRGVRTRSENKRGVPYTIHTEPFFNDDAAMQKAVQANPAEFSALYRTAFGEIPNARLIAPHGVGKDRGASSSVFGDETSYGELMANSLLGQPYSASPQATANTQGAAPMMQQQEEKPRGLLGSLGIQKMEEGAAGETGQRFYQRDSFKDTAAILAQGFGRMGIMGMEEIADDIAKQRTENKARNKTLEYLRGLPNGEELVKLADVAGPKAVAEMVLKSQFETPKTSAKEEQIARLMSTGVPENIAIGIADGRLVVSRDSVTGEATVVDKAQLMSQQDSPTAPVEVAPEGDEPAGKFEGTNVRGALGASGFGSNIINTVADAFGAGQPADKISNAATALESLSITTMLGLSAEFPGRPSNLTREKIEKLTIKPGELALGPDKALNKAQQMVQTIEQSLAAANNVVQGRASPADKAAAEQSIRALTPLLQDYSSLLRQLQPTTPAAVGGVAIRKEVADRLGAYN